VVDDNARMALTKAFYVMHPKETAQFGSQCVSMLLSEQCFQLDKIGKVILDSASLPSVPRARQERESVVSPFQVCFII